METNNHLLLEWNNPTAQAIFLIISRVRRIHNINYIQIVTQFKIKLN